MIATISDLDELEVIRSLEYLEERYLEVATDCHHHEFKSLAFSSLKP